MSAGRPLAGVSVLLTHAPGALQGLPDLLRSLGAEPHHRPAIAFGPPADPGPARRAAREAGSYAWIVFTSANGARFFGTPPPPGPRVAAVGPATARALDEVGMRPEVVAEDGRAETLSALLAPKVTAGDRVLLVRPEEARDVLADTLRATGATVDPVAFYRTVPAPDAAETAARIAAGRYHAVVFGSPSAVRALIEAGADLGGLRRVAIGEITAAALRAAGFPPDAVPDRPTAGGIAEALRATMRPLSGTPRPEDA